MTDELTEEDLEKIWEEARERYLQLDRAYLDHRMNDDKTIKEILENHEINEEQHK